MQVFVHLSRWVSHTKSNDLLLIPQFCPQCLEHLLGTVQFLEPVYHWSRSAAELISEVSHWLQCIQFRAESRSRFFLGFYSFSCGEEAGNREISRFSRRMLESRRKLHRTERIDCAIAGRMDTLCKDRAGKAPVADLSANQGRPSQAETVPFRVDEDRIGGSAIHLSDARSSTSYWTFSSVVIKHALSTPLQCWA